MPVPIMVVQHQHQPVRTPLFYIPMTPVPMDGQPFVKQQQDKVLVL
jgi:hypothetical protein